MSEDRPDTGIDWDEVVGDFAIVAAHIKRAAESDNPDDLAAIFEVSQTLLEPVLRAVPLQKLWAANVMQREYHEGTLAPLREKMN